MVFFSVKIITGLNQICYANNMLNYILSNRKAELPNLKVSQISFLIFVYTANLLLTRGMVPCCLACDR